jgi:hypothetical protein
MNKLNAPVLDVDARFNEMINEVARQHPVRVLYVEDDVTAASYVARLFDGKPVEFMHAQGVSEADQLLSSFPDVEIVVVDISLGSGVPSGEEWVLRNRDLLKGKLILILSGQLGQIRDFQKLRDMVSRIIEKGEEEQRDLWQFPARLARKRAADLVQNRVTNVEEEFVQSLEDLDLSGANVESRSASASESLRQVMLGLFRQWVNRMPKPEQGLIFMGESKLSASDLLREVELGTKRGNTFLRLFAEDLSDLI